jgi:hypothetical protein
MNNNSSPGPDGFGPAFYKKHWDLVKNSLLASLDDFHSLSTNLRPSTNPILFFFPRRQGLINLTTSVLYLSKMPVLNSIPNVLPCGSGH